MNRQKSHWIKEAYKELELALIGCRKKTREHILLALEALEKHEKEKK